MHGTMKARDFHSKINSSLALRTESLSAGDVVSLPVSQKQKSGVSGAIPADLLMLVSYIHNFRRDSREVVLSLSHSVLANFASETESIGSRWDF